MFPALISWGLSFARPTRIHGIEVPSTVGATPWAGPQGSEHVPSVTGTDPWRRSYLRTLERTPGWDPEGRGARVLGRRAEKTHLHFCKGVPFEVYIFVSYSKYTSFGITISLNLRHSSTSLIESMSSSKSRISSSLTSSSVNSNIALPFNLWAATK